LPFTPYRIPTGTFGFDNSQGLTGSIQKNVIGEYLRALVVSLWLGDTDSKFFQ
jgi:hypothetical protein